MRGLAGFTLSEADFLQTSGLRGISTHLRSACSASLLRHVGAPEVRSPTCLTDQVW